METRGKLRCSRCIMVVLDVFPQIMQDLMKYSDVRPSDVYNKIINTKRFRDKLNSNEMHSIQSLTTDGYTKLDVSLIYKIVKYFKIYIPEPSRKWGSTPQQNENEIGDDVERIRIARNMLVHKVKAEISEEDMEDFFTKFLDVANRVDQYLEKPPDSAYEQTIKNYRTLLLDEEMAEHYRKALQEIESLKEKFTVPAVQKEIHILVGKTMDDLVDKIRNCDAESTTNVKFIIEGVEEPEKQIELLNSLRGQINSHSENIHFKQATKECIALYVEMKNRVLQSERLLKSEVCSFIQRILSMIDFTLNLEEDISVVVTSAEDDHDPFDIPLSLSKEKTNPPDIWSGNNSIVLNLEIKNEVFQTPETMQQNISEFVENIFRKSNGRQHIRQRDIIVILEPGEEDSLVTKSTTGKETIVTKPWSSADEKVKYSDTQYAMAPSSPCKDNENSFDAGEHSQSDFGKAQCPLYSPSEKHLVNVPPRFRQIQREHTLQEIVKHWKCYFGFRRLIELKEKDPETIVIAFANRKTHLIDALNDKDMHQNKDIIVFLLECFAKCCQCDNLPQGVTDILDILQYSLFLRESVITFIDDIAGVTTFQREGYYQQSMKNLFHILIKLKSNKSVFEKCLTPIMVAVERRKDYFNDIFDDHIWQIIDNFKDMKVQDKFKSATEECSDVDEIAQLTTEKSESFGSLEEQKRRRSLEKQRSVTVSSYRQSEKWRLVLSLKKLMELKEAHDYDIVQTFHKERSALYDALNDEKLIHNTDIVSLFLRCFAKSCESDSLQQLQIEIFEILIHSIFLKDHVVSFVKSIAEVTHQKRIISIKQSLNDIFCIFDIFNTLIPGSVPSLHDILLKIDTPINIISAQQTGSEWMDDTMWQTFHTLMDRTIATSPTKRE